VWANAADHFLLLKGSIILDKKYYSNKKNPAPAGLSMLSQVNKVGFFQVSRGWIIFS